MSNNVLKNDCVCNETFVLRKRASFCLSYKIYLKISTVGLNADRWRLTFCFVIIIKSYLHSLCLDCVYMTVDSRTMC